MILFFYRIFLDVAYGAIACSYMAFCILYSYFTDRFKEQQVFIVYLGFPLQTTAAIRMTIAVAISIERVLVRFSVIACEPKYIDVESILRKIQCRPV